MISRRRFLDAAVGAALLAGCEREKSRVVPGEITGASFRRGHRLWQGGRFPVAAETLRCDVAVVGGGIAGLAAARRLDRGGTRNIALLELEDEAGGNSAFSANAVSAYPWGAHYVTLPAEEAGEVIALYEELGLITGRDGAGRPIYDERALVMDPPERLWMLGRWQEGLSPKLGASDVELRELAAFQRETRRLRDARGADGRRAFAIPVDRSSRDPEWLALDKITMGEWLDARGWRSPRLRWFVDYACRDDFGATLDQVSAWGALHYYAARNGIAANAETDAVLTWPEGNGFLTRRLREGLEDRVHSACLAWRVEAKPGGGSVIVDAWDFRLERPVRWEARAAVVCTPLHVTRRVVPALRERRLAPPPDPAPWVVVNLTLDRRPAGQGFALAWDNVLYDSRSLGYVVATHQRLDRPGADAPTVLTWYQPLCDGPLGPERVRAMERTHADWCELALADLRRAHPDIDRSVQRADVRVWGHGMTRPAPGWTWGGSREQWAEPLGTIHFAHSDLSGISIFEEAYTRGVLAAEAVAAQMAAV